MAFRIKGLFRQCLYFSENLISVSNAPNIRWTKHRSSSQFASYSSVSDLGAETSMNSKKTISSVLESWETRFINENIPEPKSSIQNIILHVMGGRNFSELEKNADVAMTDEEVEETSRLCECRLARMPVQYIIREWEFRGMRLQMAPPVFIPRPETEQLVDLAMSCLPHANECDNCSISEGCKINVLEIGTGCGAISLALLKEHLKVHCVAVDQSTTACCLTQQNAINLGVADRITVLHAKLGDDAKFNRNLGLKHFDLIISNPPYVSSKDILELEPEIKLYEDLRALDGGVDGLRIVKPILKVSSQLLRHKGHLLLEVDTSHPDIISKWLLDSEQSNLRLKCQSIYEDIFKKPRFVQIIKGKDF